MFKTQYETSNRGVPWPAVGSARSRSRANALLIFVEWQNVIWSPSAVDRRRQGDLAESVIVPDNDLHCIGMAETRPARELRIWDK
jgi:hypothetical protein